MASTFSFFTTTNFVLKGDLWALLAAIVALATYLYFRSEFSSLKWVSGFLAGVTLFACGALLGLLRDASGLAIFSYAKALTFSLSGFSFIVGMLITGAREG